MNSPKTFFPSPAHWCVLLLLLAFTGGTWGISNAQGVGGGVTAGFTTSQIDGDDWGGYNFWGYQLGGFAYYDFNDKLALQVEIATSLRGSREAGIGRIALNFIDVPILLRYRKSLNSGDLDVESGLSGNLLLAGRTGLRPFTFDQTDLFRRFSTEFHLGLAYYFVENVGLFARWSIGLTNLQSNAQLRPWLTIHNFTAGIRLRFK